MPEPMGDCDDFSMLVASFLTILGLPVWFVAVAADRDEPDRFSHVYVRTESKDCGSVVMDCSHGAYPGWETDLQFRRLEWRVN